jgi:hypothetical protein
MKVLLWFEPCPFVDVSNRELAGKGEQFSHCRSQEAIDRCEEKLPEAYILKFPASLA